MNQIIQVMEEQLPRSFSWFNNLLADAMCQYCHVDNRGFCDHIASVISQLAVSSEKNVSNLCKNEKIDGMI